MWQETEVPKSEARGTLRSESTGPKVSQKQPPTHRCSSYLSSSPFPFKSNCSNKSDIGDSKTCTISSSSSSISQWHPHRRSKKMSTATSFFFFLLTCLSVLDSCLGQKYNPKWPDPMLRREIFLLNLEDGYFGCQVNDSADFLQLFELSQLCDGRPQCFRGSDELSLELKCSDRNHCHPKMPKCVNGVCLDGLCYCNDGFGGKGCDLPGRTNPLHRYFLSFSVATFSLSVTTFYSKITRVSNDTFNTMKHSNY